MSWFFDVSQNASDAKSSEEKSPTGSFWDTVKRISTDVVDAYKEDINEFTSTITGDTKQFAEQIRKDAIKRGASDSSVRQSTEGSEEAGNPQVPTDSTPNEQSPDMLMRVTKKMDRLSNKIDTIGQKFMSQLSALALGPEEADEADPTDRTDPQMLDEIIKGKILQDRISALRANPNTFLEPPEDSKAFDTFMESFHIDSKDNDILAIMREDPPMAKLYDRIVPSGVSRQLFWGRYFFAVGQLYSAQEHQEALMKKMITGEEEEDELAMGWGMDDGDEASPQHSSSTLVPGHEPEPTPVTPLESVEDEVTFPSNSVPSPTESPCKTGSKAEVEASARASNSGKDCNSTIFTPGPPSDSNGSNSTAGGDVDYAASTDTRDGTSVSSGVLVTTPETGTTTVLSDSVKANMISSLCDSDAESESGIDLAGIIDEDDSTNSS
eukprot:Rmarinus@m.27431